MVGMEIAHAVCAITNPFCEASRESKWPDQSSGRTLAIPVRMRYNLTTDSDGRAGVVFTPRYSAGILPGTVNSSGEFFLVSGAAPDTIVVASYAPVFAGADQFRVVSAGVRVTPVTSAMNSQGIVNMIELPPADSGYDYNNVQTANKNYPSYESLPLKAQDSLYGIMRPNGATAREFRDTYDAGDTPISNFSSGDWTSLLIAVEGGAPTTTVAVLDLFLNFEITLGTADPLGYIITRAPRANIQLTQLSNDVSQEVAIYRGTDRSVDESFLSKAWNYARSAGLFLKDNAGSIANVGMAIVNARAGNLAGASGHLMMLADRPRDVN